jgi:hypothetical protein
MLEPVEIRMAAVSLLRAGVPLAKASRQLQILRADGLHKPFEASLVDSGLYRLSARRSLRRLAAGGCFRILPCQAG